MSLAEAEKWAAGKFFKLDDGDEVIAVRVGDIDMVMVGFKDEAPKPKARAYFYVAETDIVQQFDMNQTTFRALRSVEKAAGAITPNLRITRNGTAANTKYLFKVIGPADKKTIDAAQAEFKSFVEREGLEAPAADPMAFLEEVKV